MRKVMATAIGAVVAAGLVAGPAGAASTKTFHLFSKEASSTLYDAGGAPIAEPTAGSFFVATDNDYKGDHKKHSKKVFATDHIKCTFTEAPSPTASVTCDGQFALPGGMVFFDNAKVQFSAKTVIPLTGGTGKYAKAKGGTVAVTALNEDNTLSDLVVKVKF